MAIHFTCAECQKSIKVADELAGSSGQCPGCMAPITVPAQVATVAASKAAASLELTGKVLEPAWHTVRRGLSTVYVATACWIVMASMVGLILFDPSRFLPFTTGILAVSAPPLGLLASVLLLIGHCKCCRTPVRSGARGFAIACVSCLILCVGVLFLKVFLEIKGGSLGPEALGIVPGAFGMVFFALFVSRIGRFFENRRLERNAKRWILFSLLSPSLCFGLMVLDALFARRLGMRITGMVVAAALVMLIWYMRLIRGARDTIREAQAASRASD